MKNLFGAYSGIILVLLWGVIVLGVAISAAVVFALIARIILFFRYRRLQKIESETGYTASTATRTILDANEMQDVKIEKCGFFRALFYGNSYSVRKKTIFLRKSILNSPTLTAVSVAMQKVGIAIMDKRGEKSVKVRSVLLPLTYISPLLFIPLVIVGLVIDFVVGFSGIPTIISAAIGLVIYLLAFVYMLVNLKIEKKANRLAMGILEKSNFLNVEERAEVQKLFDAYILKYVADFIVSILQLIYQFFKLLATIFKTFKKK